MSTYFGHSKMILFSYQIYVLKNVVYINSNLIIILKISYENENCYLFFKKMIGLLDFQCRTSLTNIFIFVLVQHA